MLSREHLHLGVSRGKRIQRFMDSTEHRPTRQVQPGTVYRIIVRGRLDPSWSERLSGMQIIPVGDKGSAEMNTKLIGPVRDQAELTGVLNTLSGMRLALLSVQADEPETTNPSLDQ